MKILIREFNTLFMEILKKFLFLETFQRITAVYSEKILILRMFVSVGPTELDLRNFR